MLDKIRRSDKPELILASVLAVLSGLLLGLVIMMFVNINSSIGAFFNGIILSGFEEGAKSIGDFLYYSTALILTGLSVGFAFRSGLFNIGATGQLTMGAFTAIYIGVNWTFLPAPFHWIIAVLGSIVAGALWALIPGLLKAYRNVHEVVATIMMNYIAAHLVQLLIVYGDVFNSSTAQTYTVARSARIPKLGMDILFPGSQATGGFYIALLAVGITYVIITKTTLGYQLRAVGYNRDAAKYAGINDKRNIVYSMVISGGLAGLAGATMFLVASGQHLEMKTVLLPEGFEGIAVALLGMSHPIGIFFAGLFFGYIKNAYLPLQSWGYTKEIIDIIVASIIYFSAISLVFRKSSRKILEGFLIKDGDRDDK